MSLSTYHLEYGRHIGRLHRRRAYAPMSNTAAHDNHEKINSWVSFSQNGYGALLGGPSARGAPLSIGSGQEPEENISRARKVLSPRFLYSSSLMEKRYLVM